MYCVDTLKRLNDEAVEEHRASKPDCEYCDNKATETLEIFNPADAVREPPVEGAYCTVDICDDCRDGGVLYNEYFSCTGCGEMFISNHSWDSLVVIVDGEEMCHKCVAESIEPVFIDDLIYKLMNGDTSSFTRINSIPGKKLLWEGEYSDYDDFSGFTSLEDVANEIPVDKDYVYPIITHTYQFSVALAIYG